MTDLIRILRAGRLCLGTGLILLALWGQAIAPLAAPGQPAAAPRGLWADPAGLPAICGHAADAPSVEDRGPAAPACHACPLCAAGLSIPVVPHAPSAGRRQAWHGVAWPIPPPSPPARPHRPSGQPRAPPASS